MKSKNPNQLSNIGWFIWLSILLILTLVGFILFSPSKIQNSSISRDETLNELIDRINTNYEIVVAPENATKQYIDSINTIRSSQAKVLENVLRKQFNESMIFNFNTLISELDTYNRMIFVWISLLTLLTLFFLSWLYFLLKRQLKQVLNSKSTIDSIVDSNEMHPLSETKKDQTDAPLLQNRKYSRSRSYISTIKANNDKPSFDDKYASLEAIAINKQSELKQNNEELLQSNSELGTVPSEVDISIENFSSKMAEISDVMGFDDISENQDVIERNKKIEERLIPLTIIKEQPISDTEAESKYLARLSDISSKIDKVDSLLSLIKEVNNDDVLSLKQKNSLAYDINICLANAYCLDDQIYKSFDIYDNLIELDPLNEIAYIERGKLFKESGKVQNAIENFNTALDLSPHNLIIYKNRAKTFLEMSDFENAIADYDVAFLLSSNSVGMLGDRAMAYFLSEKYLEAIADYDKIVELDSGNTDIYLKRAICLYYTENFVDAIADLNLFLKSSPSNAEAIKYRAYSYAKSNQLDNALSDFEQLVLLGVSDPEIYFNLATIYLNKNNFSIAIDNFSKSIELDKSNGNAYYLRGIAYSKNKNYGKAIADFDTSVSLLPFNADVYYNRGNAYANLKKYEDAIVDFTEAIKINPAASEAYFSRANIYYNQLQYTDALDDYAKAIEINKEYTKAYYNRGLAYKASKKYKEALNDFDIAKKIDSNNIRLVEKANKQIEVLKNILDEVT